MSKIVPITSSVQFQDILKASKLVVTDFYADWCGPCKAIAPIYEQLATSLSRPGKVTFTRIDTDAQQELAQQHGVTALPTFMVFKNAAAVETVQGANPRRLQEVVSKIAAEAGSDSASASGGFGAASSSSLGASSSSAGAGFGSGPGSGSGSSSSGSWLGASLPRGYKDITSQVDARGLDLLNADASGGGARVLFDGSRPSALGAGKSKDDGAKDWVESDTDEQLMLFVPFQSTLKAHTLHVTSLPPKEGESGADEEPPMRPRTLQIYSNRAHCLGFAEAEGIPATHTATLAESDWDADTGTAKVELRFVKFQNVSSLVIFVVDGDGDGDKVRLDRIRIVGEAGEKREMGKLEKVGDDP